ncbi:unnamed protein product [Trichobilharzia regenti]|uniref:Transmembrane protein n=1 Tax=Trichobilharzia regenti TaxID=157069 RepID=A0A183WUU1_TRIRE|nr:unnamed protein product [Trichobilharzia regenti]VDQ11773.1 unnamed protein product [Trichobilharzia regenti]
MKPRSLSLEFLASEGLVSFLENVSNLDLCPQTLRNQIQQSVKNTTVSFHLINECYDLTRKLSGNGNDRIYLPFWRIAQLTSIVLPKIKHVQKETRSDAHFEELRKKYENNCYEKMTRDFGSSLVFSTASRVKRTTVSDFKCLNKQLIMILNFCIIVASGFAFGYFVPDIIFSGNSVSLFTRIVCALLSSSIVLAADLYFLIRNFSLIEKAYG